MHLLPLTHLLQSYTCSLCLVGGLDYEMTEGDVLSVFSQYVM